MINTRPLFSPNGVVVLVSLQSPNVTRLMKDVTCRVVSCLSWFFVAKGQWGSG